jgi:FkbM family methyltransferase
MKLYKNTIIGLRYKRWTRLEAIAYFIKGVARELKIAPSFFLKQYEKITLRIFKKKWLKQNEEESYFDFNGAKFPDISDSPEKMGPFRGIFEDTFLFPCYFNDKYDKETVEHLDQYMIEGPYGYVDGYFDVTVKKNDIVIDAGAWIGDFSAYAASKDAMAYAFEPVSDTFHLLCKTASLNNTNDGKHKIYPIRKGLGSSESEMDIFIDKNNSGANSILDEKKQGDINEKISITTLDRFVEENKLERVDFIKADIEGAERDMLRGATNVLKTFAPKLAICTYHLPDDPEVLENIIKEANPAYKVVQLRHKLFAAVPEINK